MIGRARAPPGGKYCYLVGLFGFLIPENNVLFNIIIITSDKTITKYIGHRFTCYLTYIVFIHHIKRFQNELRDSEREHIILIF